MEIRSLFYISRGNIPSLSANSIQVVKMAQAFAQVVDEVTLVTSGHISPFVSDTGIDLSQWYRIKHPFKLVRLPVRWNSTYPLHRGYHSRSFLRLGGLYSALLRPDLMVSRSLEPISIAVRCGVSAVYETHSAEIDGPMLRRLFDTGKLVAIVTISEYLKELYCTIEGIPEDKVWVLPDGVDLEGYYTDQSQNDLRRELGLPVDTVIAAYAGHLYENRGIEEIFACAARLPKVYFAIVGGYPDDVERRRAEIREQGLDNVILTGFVSNALVPKYLRAANILLMPYSQYVDTVRWMSPLKLFEYMGAERPIIASKLPSLQSVLSDGENSLLVEPDSADALMEGIEILIKDSNLANRLGKKALEDVHSFTWEKRARTIIERCGDRDAIK